MSLAWRMSNTHQMKYKEMQRNAEKMERNGEKCRMTLEGMEIVKEVKIVLKKGYDVSSVAIYVSTLVYNVISSRVHQNIKKLSEFQSNFI